MPSFVQRSAPAAGSWSTIGAIPSDGSIGTVNIRLVNRDQLNAITVSLAITAAASAPGVADMIEPPSLVLKAGAVLEETAVAVTAGEVVQVFPSAATLTARVHGR
jgi:hypothetical protein